MLTLNAILNIPTAKSQVSAGWDLPYYPDLTVKPDENAFVDLPVDPLALILKWRDTEPVLSRKAMNSFAYKSLEVYPGRTDYDFPTVEQLYVDHAETINRHFRNKFMMHGLQSEFGLSDFRIALMDHLENPLHLVNKHIKILLRLPEFYLEDKIMEKLMSEYVSAEYDFIDIDTRLEFVDSITRAESRRPHTRFYFATPDKQLICLNVEDKATVLPAMHYITKQTSVGFKGPVYARHYTGYTGFNFYHTGGNNYEFY